MWRLGKSEFLRTEKQARGKALCPFCGLWAPTSGGLPHGEPACAAVYGRLNSVAVFCRVLADNGYRTPTDAEMRTVLNRAKALMLQNKAKGNTPDVVKPG